MENNVIPVLDETNFEEILTRISVEEAEEEYDYSSAVMNLYFDEDSDVEDPAFYCYRGDLHVSSITMGATTGISKFNLIVDGNLYVDGDIVLNSTKDMGFVIVRGDVTAKNVIVSGCVEVNISGSLTVQGVILGHSGTGMLGVDEIIAAKIIIDIPEYTMYFYDEIKAVVLADPVYTNDEVDYEENQAAKALLPEFVNSEGKPNIPTIIKAINEDRDILLDDISSTHTYSDENLVTPKVSDFVIKDIINEGQALSAKKKHHDAYRLFKENMPNVNLKRDDYDSLYYYYAFLFCIGDYVDTFSKEEAIPYMKEYIEYAHILLDEVNNGMDLFYYNPISKFHREVRKIANNGLAWFLMELGELDEALQYAEKAVSLIESDADDYLLDMIVRVLMKMERSEEAYQIVKRTLDKNPKYRFFQEYVKDSDYLDWKKQNFQGENKEAKTIEEAIEKFNNFVIGLGITDNRGRHCNPIFEFGEGATEKQIEQLKEAFEISMPKELEDFYRNLGCLKPRAEYNVHEDHDIHIFRIESMLKTVESDEGDESYALGLIESIVEHWEGERYEFTDDLGEDEKEMFSKINSRFKCIGEYALDWGFEESYYIIFDESGKFGAVRYHQDEYDKVIEQFKELLKGNKLTLSLKEVIEKALNEIKGVIKYN